jgi:hypothetical protein
MNNFKVLRRVFHRYLVAQSFFNVHHLSYFKWRIRWLNERKIWLTNIMKNLPVLKRAKSKIL